MRNALPLDVQINKRKETFPLGDNVEEAVRGQEGEFTFSQ